MSTMSVIAQIIGAITIILIPMIYACKTKDKFYMMHILLGVLRMIQYILLGAWTGAISGFCSTIKNIVYLRFSLKKQIAPAWTMLLFMFIAIGLSALGFKGFISLLPLLTIAITGYGNWQHKYSVMCVCNIIGVVLGFTYSFAVGAYGGLLAYIIEIIAAVVGMVNNKRNNVDSENTNK